MQKRIGTPRVLVVDDEPGIVRIVTRLLEDNGYEVIAAASPREALAKVDGGQPVDVVVSDVVMPEMSGPELVRQVQEHAPSTAAVLMSGYTGAGTLPESIPFLTKPFSAAELLAIVRQVLQESKAAREGCGAARKRTQELRSEAQQLIDEIAKIEDSIDQTMEQSERILDARRSSKLPGRKPPDEF
jgi:DNA-binding NtrC family response regulator